jgi:sulfopyruvate decarboxylase subunit alpha
MADATAALCEGLLSSKVSHCVYLPDSVLNPLTAAMEYDPAIATVVCAREDEGVAIAAGLFLAGRRAVVMMECSGLGYCGLILARCELMRTPVFVIASHGGLLGEAFDYHAAPVAAGRGMVEGLHLHHAVLRPEDDPAEIVRLALDTVHGHRRSFVLFVPPYVLKPRKASA